MLLALAWPHHIHHEPAHRWFAGRGRRKWATCPLTQFAFVRLSSQAVVVKMAITVQAALRTLDVNLASDDHEFWPMERGFPEILSEIRDGLAGHHQLADALLLDLAIRRSGTLATLDRRVASLLPSDSPHRGVIELVPVL